MKKKRKTAKAPARRKSVKRSTSTALARREDVARIAVEDPNGLLANPEGFELGDLAKTGGVGAAVLKLTKAESKILTAKVNEKHLAVLPNSGIAYLPHPHYTQWLNKAVGLGQWAIAPAGRAAKVEGLIIVPHILYIKGTPAAWANGGAQYYEKNKQQTYDDVLESTGSYALRRCCKHLGMALELWSKSWQNAFKAKNCIQVRVKTNKGIEQWWRLKTDPPFDDELRAGDRQQAPASNAPPAAIEGEVLPADPADKERISKGDAARLVRIWRSAGRRDADVKLWLTKVFGYTATADIKRFDLQRIERALKARGDLLIPGDE